MKQMKNLKFIYCILVGMIIVSCTDQSTFRNPAIHELENGSFVEWQTVPPTSFDSVEGFAISGSLQDVNSNTSSYSLSVEAKIDGAIVSAEDFYTVNSFPAEVNITVTDIATALGLTTSDISMGDFFQFYGKTTRNDGTVFYGTSPDYGSHQDNSKIGYTQSNLNLNASYTSAMSFNAILACPIPNNMFVGTYNMTVDPENILFGVPSYYSDVDVEVQIFEGSVYQRYFEVDFFPDFGFDTNSPFILDFICGGVDANAYIAYGLGCSGSLYAQGDGNFTTYDEADDSVITITVTDNAGSDCGGGPVAQTITLTKI